jgi:hypothetical protein
VYSGAPADPPSNAFIMRNSMDAEHIAVGWWPGDGRYGKAAFYGYAYEAGEEFRGADLAPSPGRWNESLGEYLLDWDELRTSPDPSASAGGFLRAISRLACTTCGWDPALGASLEGDPPPIR